MNPRTSNRRLFRRIYVLPSLLTLGNFFCGFLSIVLCLNALFFATRAAMMEENAVRDAFAAPAEITAGFAEGTEGRKQRALHTAQGGYDRAAFLFHWACVVIFFGMIFDMLDGKVARAIGASSAFGTELDSLADVTTFGVAPAFIVNTISLAFMPASYAWWSQVIIFGVIYAMCGVLRLARYNIQSGTADKNVFSGLPIPAAAGCVVSAVLLVESEYAFVNVICSWLVNVPYLGADIIQVKARLLSVFLLLPGLLMVTTIPFAHLANRYLSGKKSFTTLVAAVLLLTLVWQEPRLMLFIMFNGYMVGGLVAAARKKMLMRKTSASPAAGNDESGA